MKSHTRLLAGILLISAIASSAGCSKNNKNESSNVISNSETEKNNINFLVNKNEDVSEIYSQFVIDTTYIEEILKNNLYDEKIDYKLVIDLYLNNYELRNEYKNEYLKAIYMLLINTEVPMSEYLKELHTMVLMQQVPMCVPENVWVSSFKNLIAIDPNCVSLFDEFCDFAIYIHSLECSEEHELNEFNCYTCNSLEEEYKRKLILN